MGQYVKRGNKTYYKADDGRLYADFAAANAAQSQTGLDYGLRQASKAGQFLLGLGRSVRAAVDPNFAADEYRRQWEQGEIGAATVPPVAPGPTPIVVGADLDGNVDRTKSDLYKQYAQTPEGQFERYFQTPEMDRYFGAASRGKGAPKDVVGMQALAGELTAPQDVPLSSYYRAQSAMGRAQMPEIQKGLGYEEGSDLAKWAAANPMLAQRLYAKQQASAPAQAQPSYGAGVQPLTEAESFSMAANGVPAPWNEQGEKVSREFEGVVPFQAAKTTGEGMPAFQTTGEKTAEFLKRPGISSLF